MRISDWSAGVCSSDVRWSFSTPPGPWYLSRPVNKRSKTHASQRWRPQAATDFLPSRGAVPQHGGFAHQACADHDYHGKGEGTAPLCRKADYACEEGWPCQSPPGPRALAGRHAAQEAVRSACRAVQGPQWRLHRSERHTSELQSLMRITYAVFSLKKKTIQNMNSTFSYKQ